jgi:Ca2+-transporting ATPase
MVAKSAWIGGKTYNVSGVALEPVGDITLDGVVIAPGKDALKGPLGDALYTGALCGTSTLYHDLDAKVWKSSGSPTEVALQVLAAKMQLVKPYVALCV